MTSNLCRYVPPSLYTPFLRRFTDERALDLTETKALYEAITAQFYTSVLATPDVIDKFNHILTRQVAEYVDLSPGPVCEALDRCQTAVLALETTLFTTAVITDWSALSLREQVDLRRYLRAQQHVLAHQERVLELLATALTNVFAGILGALPPLSQDSSLFQVPLFTFLDVNDIVDRLIGTLAKSEHDDNGLFVSLTDQLNGNICTASKVMPHESHKRPLITTADSDLPPRDIIDTYLKGTPFLDLLETPVPFVLPPDKRFEHTHMREVFTQRRETSALRD